jgi:hypothetical protein
MPRGDLGVDVVPVVRAIGGEGGDRTVDLIEQGADPRAVIDVVAGQLRRDDPAGVGVRGEVERLWGGGDVNQHRRRTQPDGDAPCHSRTT